LAKPPPTWGKPKRRTGMARGPEVAPPAKGLSFCERYLTLWVVCCIAAGIVLGKIAPRTAAFLDGLAL
jgi:arsenite transporter